MDPLIGQTLAHYTIVEKIGGGGMGIVYRARDERLGRNVAIKMIPEHLSGDPLHLSRLSREARILASLNHPNIAAIYGLETLQQGGQFLVLELVDGETLADRLQAGPLRILEALQVLHAIASALEAAHERGVIHRDMKPANVMLTARGVVKVLDFGLARHAPASPGYESGDPSTTTTPITELGKVVGTPGYMSPEQVLAGSQDRRVDIFGFGCVAYECVTGRRVFEGATVSERLSAALSRSPSWSNLPETTPRRLRDLMAHCLARDPLERASDIGDCRLELEELLRSTRASMPVSAVAAIAAPHNLPERLTSFIGREKELRECIRLSRQARLITLTGAGGCGKTRLALRLAMELQGRFPDGLWLIDLAPLVDPLRVPLAVATSLGLREQPGTPLVQTLTNHLAGKRVLLVLDNCEHLASACGELVTRLLKSCSTVAVVATSREPLHVTGEWIFSVPPLSTPRAESSRTAAEAGRFEAVRLFVERAGLVAPGFRLSDRVAPVVAEICRRLDGIPLAIELAAARIRVLTPEEIKGRLGDQFRLLAGQDPAVLPRHQTLEAAIDWSYSQLTDQEARLFRAFAVFAGGWAWEAAAEVAGERQDEFEILDIVTRLVDKSLVLVEGIEGVESRCRFLETVRQYALGKLREAQEEPAARLGHVTHFLKLAESASPQLTGPRQGVWLARLETDHENLLAALSWCRGAPDRAGEALRLASSLWRFWMAHGHFAIGREALEGVLRSSARDEPSGARMEALSGAGALAFHQNDWSTGRACYQESLEMARTLGLREGEGHALSGLGNLALGQGDYAGARSRYEEAMTCFGESGHRRGIGIALSNLGRVAELQGDHVSAYPLYEQGLAVFREVGDVGSVAMRLSSLAELSLNLGRRDAARGQLVECLQLIRTLEEKRAGAYALERCAVLVAQVARGRDATVLYGASDAVRTAIGSPLTPREMVEKDAQVAAVRKQLGENRFLGAWEQGRHLAFEGAVDHALQCLETAGVAPGSESMDPDSTGERSRPEIPPSESRFDTSPGVPGATSKFHFPEGFLFGAATSSHQVEGNCTNNDWWAWEQAGRVPDPSGLACDHYRRYREDLDLAQQLRHNAHRFSLEWSRIEPEDGRFSEEALAHYRDVLQALRGRGMEPIVTINHFTLPRWLAERGGWDCHDMERLFERYVEVVVEAYADLARWWITLNEPSALILKGYLLGEWPPGKKDQSSALGAMGRMLRAHVRAYDAIHRRRADAMVSIAHHALALSADDQSRLLDRLSLRARSYIVNHLVLKALVRGVVRVPGLLWERYARGRTIDFIGLNYYTRDFVRNAGFDLPGLLGSGTSRDHHLSVGARNELGWEVYPEGLGHLLEEYARYRVPILITENGISTQRDAARWLFIYMHLWQVARGLSVGVPIVGYLYWSLLDNFEWADGYKARFGLIEVDYATQKRRVRESALQLREVIRRNRL